MVPTVDIDFAVLCVANVRMLRVCELWVTFGSRKHLQYMPTYAIVDSVGRGKCDAVLFSNAVMSMSADFADEDFAQFELWVWKYCEHRWTPKHAKLSA